MSLELAALLALLGLLAAFLSGLLGIGGALMLIPMLLYVPQAFGLADFDVKSASAIGVAQVAVASGSGTFANYRRGLIYRRLAVIIVSSMVTAALISGWLSQFMPAGALLAVLATLATLGAVTMLLPVTGGELGPAQPAFTPLVAVLCGTLVGSVIGLVGGGSFMLIPLQVYLLGMPTRTAMATGLAAVLPTAFAGLIGKGLGGQVPVLPAIMVCLLSIPGAQLGTATSARVSARTLRRIYTVVVLTVAVGLWYDVVSAR
jgi:uncharacterized membrane protein YfcA